MLRFDWERRKQFCLIDIMIEKDKTFIDKLFEEQKGLIIYLQEQGQISYSQDVESFLSKALLLSCASYFEDRIVNAIAGYAKMISNADEALVSLVRIKVIDRKYHTYFTWEGRGVGNVMSFFGMFGTTIKDIAKKELKGGELLKSVEAFLELGETRNLLVHENYAMYPLEKTADEIYMLYRMALRFVMYIEVKLSKKITETTSISE